MSVIVYGMEMPKGRPVCIVIDAAGQARRYDLNNDRYADDKLFEAVPVPAHGDLIDASTKVTIRIYDDMYEEYRDEECTIADTLDRWSNEGCPEAIIPASGGKEDE